VLISAVFLWSYSVYITSYHVEQSAFIGLRNIIRKPIETHPDLKKCPRFVHLC